MQRRPERPDGEIARPQNKSLLCPSRLVESANENEITVNQTTKMKNEITFNTDEAMQAEVLLSQIVQAIAEGSGKDYASIELTVTRTTDGTTSAKWRGYAHDMAYTPYFSSPDEVVKVLSGNAELWAQAARLREQANAMAQRAMTAMEGSV
jgi:hypothetical protein